jgi:hypothetical protein
MAGIQELLEDVAFFILTSFDRKTFSLFEWRSSMTHQEVNPKEEAHRVEELGENILQGGRKK